MTDTVVVIVSLPDGGAGAFTSAQVAEARARAESLGFAPAQTAAAAPAPERWLDSRQLAALTGVGDTSWEALARSGRIPSRRVGKLVRFKLTEVERALRDP